MLSTSGAEVPEYLPQGESGRCQFQEVPEHSSVLCVCCELVGCDCGWIQLRMTRNGIETILISLLCQRWILLPKDFSHKRHRGMSTLLGMKIAHRRN